MRRIQNKKMEQDSTIHKYAVSLARDAILQAVSLYRQIHFCGLLGTSPIPENICRGR